MNRYAVVRSSVVVALLVFRSHTAAAECVISGARPTVPLPTTESGQEFVFIATDGCDDLVFWVQGEKRRSTHIPKPAPDGSSKDRTYKVRLPEREWSNRIDETDKTFTWSITSGTQKMTTTNDLDLDRDGWTRRDGDGGACDYSATINPGVPEICDGIDQDCDHQIDEGVIWFRDADGDGYGDETDTRCTWAEGYVDVGGDCDDSDSDAWCPTLDLALADAKLVGEEPDDLAGYSVSGAGDVDADGRDDLLVGAIGNHVGAAYLVLGPVTGTFDLALADAKLVGEPGHSGLGFAVSGAGDVDGNGHDDLLVGSWPSEKAYLVLGPVTGSLDLSLADANFVGEAAGDEMGRTLSDAGDVDGDGHDDILVGADNDDEGGLYAGAAYLVLGPVTGTLDLALADAKLVGQAVDGAGYSVSGAGDVDGDGQDDVLVGASTYSPPSLAGAAYLVHGPVTGIFDLALADATLVGEGSNDLAGWAVSDAGDVNGDGHPDLLVGSQDRQWNRHFYRGTAGDGYLVLGPVTGSFDLSFAAAKFEGKLNEYAGRSLSGAGDVNDDPYDDLLFGAYGNNQGGPDSGAAYLVLGPVTGTHDLSRSDVILVGEGPGDGAGWSVSGAGDVDGDGKSDLLVGAYGNDRGAGAAYLVLGGSL